MNFVELCSWYSQGKAVELFIDALNDSKIKKDNLFIVASIYPHDLEDVIEAEKEFESLLGKLGTNFIDSVQFTGSSLNKWSFEESIKLQEKLIDQKLSRFVSLTNVDLETLEKYNKLFDEKFFSHELHYSFEVRETEDFGLIDIAEENNIKNVIFQPLRRNRTAQRNCLC